MAKDIIPGAVVAAFANSHDITGHSLQIAVAVANAESGFNAAAKHKNVDGSTDYGLWQINSVHTEFTADESLILTPDYNAFAMSRISSSGRDWTPWVTFTTLRYVPFMPMAADSIRVMRKTGRDKTIEDWKNQHGSSIFNRDPVLGAGKGAVDTAGSIADLPGVLAGFVGKLTDSHTWYRIAQVLIGAGLLLVGIYMAVRGGMPSMSDIPRPGKRKPPAKSSAPLAGDTFKPEPAPV